MNSSSLVKLYRKHADQTLRGFKELGTDPYQDWRVCVSLTLVALLLLAAFSVYVFLQVNKGEFFVDVRKEEVKIDSIDRKGLQTTLEAFSARKLNFEDLRIHPIRLDDPSI